MLLFRYRDGACRQVVKTSDCGSDMHGFESHLAPHLKNSRKESFFMRMMRMRTHLRFEREVAEGESLTTKLRNNCSCQLKTRLMPLSKTIPSGAPLNNSRKESFLMCMMRVRTHLGFV